MKKFLLLFAVLAVLSCNNDDDTASTDNGLHTPYTGSILGTWSTTELWINGNAINLECDAVPFDENYTYNFMEDGTFTVIFNCNAAAGVINTGTYTTAGNVLTLNLDGQQAKAHMVRGNHGGELYWRFDIGSSGLFFGYEIEVNQMFD